MLAKIFDNIAKIHGEWGERTAVRVLKAKGMEILDCNSRPYARDARLEIDIVAYEPESDTLVFVEVKQHKSFSPYQRRLRSLNRRKCANMRRVCNAWRRRHKWDGGCRFDVVEIYGTPEDGEPEIDYIENVNIFTPKDRRVRWG